ncbi:uncharacterized protein LOC142338026 [Convolutriloba macropyga]|uniref:uncharacterized protein LOC142338026 n=1 Tax=Convolutriloba macropyga TaxID=536237 RepID=UPI003F51E1F2
MSRSASILRDPAEKPFVATGYNGNISPAGKTNRLDVLGNNSDPTGRSLSSPRGNKQSLATMASSAQRPPSNQVPTSHLRESYHEKPKGSTHRHVNSISSYNGENLYATSELNDNYETIPQAQLQSKRSSNRTYRAHKTSTSRISQLPEQNLDQTSDSDYAPNMQKAASLPDFHQSNLIIEDQSQHAVTDIDDLVRSSSADNLFTPAPDIPPVVKQALVDELKTVFGANGRKERVEKASEYHKRRPPLKNSMRGLRYYDPQYSEQLSRQNSSVRGQRSLAPIGDEEELLNPLDWNPDEVAQWLDQEGFGDMTSLFRDTKIDGRDLSTLSRKGLKAMGIHNSHDVEALIDAIDALFAEDSPRSGYNRRRKPSSRRPSKRRLYSSRHEDSENRPPGNSFRGGRGNVRQRNTKILKAKVPSFSRPGSELIRRQSLIAEQQKHQISPRHRKEQRKPFELEDPVLASQTSNVAEKAKWFNSNATKPKQATSRKNSPELENKSGISRVQSLRHELEVQESHRKLENIFNRKRQSKESLRKKEKNGALFATETFKSLP